MKNLKLSTELASSVLGLNVVYIESCEHRDNIIGIWTDINTKPIEEINIYEFAFKCKEWAYNQGFEIITYNLYSKDNFKVVCCPIDEVDNFSEIVSSCNTFSWFNLPTEVEAIIKACNWILEETK